MYKTHRQSPSFSLLLLVAPHVDGRIKNVWLRQELIHAWLFPHTALKIYGKYKILVIRNLQLADAVISHALLSTSEFSEVEIHKHIGVTVWMAENAFSASS